ncbi:MAG: hypothetical protein J6Z11_00205 [Candidatus Riflebacteria bacterium]|nr:hypothetical protein [Candidatus Riflebacteria bacterium]
MDSDTDKTKYIEKILAILLLFVVFLIIPLKIISKGFLPNDDANRHIAFAINDHKWSDVLEITPGLESDHNVGWHKILRFIYKLFRINKNDLLLMSTIGLFLLLNLTGTLVSPNTSAWPITLIVMFLFDPSLIQRSILGRPYIFSCITTLILLKLWFINEQQTNNKLKYFISILALTLAVWIHGTWYTFLILPAALFLSGQVRKSINLTICIILSTIIGAFLTGEFKEFLYFHYSATLNIFSEKIYNWMLVTEFEEGNIRLLWMVPTVFIIILSIISKKLKLNDLTKDPTFIMILLTWLLSIKVVRFWLDWGMVALTFWLSFKLSDLIQDMQSVKKPLLRRTFFILIVISLTMLIPISNWNNKKERNNYIADFTKKEFAEFKPVEGGIVYNDSMRHFYYQYFNDPEGKYKYVLGFEPAIMLEDNKKIFRDILYSRFHYKAYKPWVDKLTKNDRLFTIVDLSKNYPQLDWVKAGEKLYIGKVKTEN